METDVSTVSSGLVTTEIVMERDPVVESIVPPGLVAPRPLLGWSEEPTSEIPQIDAITGKNGNTSLPTFLDTLLELNIYQDVGFSTLFFSILYRRLPQEYKEALREYGFDDKSATACRGVILLREGENGFSLVVPLRNQILPRVIGANCYGELIFKGDIRGQWLTQEVTYVRSVLFRVTEDAQRKIFARKNPEINAILFSDARGMHLFVFSGDSVIVFPCISVVEMAKYVDKGAVLDSINETFLRDVINIEEIIAKLPPKAQAIVRGNYLSKLEEISNGKTLQDLKYLHRNVKRPELRFYYGVAVLNAFHKEFPNEEAKLTLMKLFVIKMLSSFHFVRIDAFFIDEFCQMASGSECEDMVRKLKGKVDGKLFFELVYDPSGEILSGINGYLAELGIVDPIKSWLQVFDNLSVSHSPSYWQRKISERFSGNTLVGLANDLAKILQS